MVPGMGEGSVGFLLTKTSTVAYTIGAIGEGTPAGDQDDFASLIGLLYFNSASDGYLILLVYKNYDDTNADYTE